MLSQADDGHAGNEAVRAGANDVRERDGLAGAVAQRDHVAGSGGDDGAAGNELASARRLEFLAGISEVCAGFIRQREDDIVAARLLAGKELLQAFGVNVLAYDPLLDEAAIAAMGAKKADLDTLLAESDVVSLHAPALDSTRHMINGRALSLMKDRAILINTARGALVDEEALAQALRGGKLKYACLDVTDPEPPAADSPLRGIPNCIMTPHLAGLANNGKLKIGAHVADEIGRFLTGGTLVSEITQAMLATIA